MLNGSPSGTFKRADWASVADASSTRSVGRGDVVDGRLERAVTAGTGSWEYREVGISACRGVEEELRRAQQAARRSARRRSMARVQTRPALLKLLGCTLQPYGSSSDQNTSVRLLLLISDPLLAQPPYFVLQCRQIYFTASFTGERTFVKERNVSAIKY